MVYGHGYKINATWKNNEQMYNIWSGILRRCFDEKHNRYKETTKICERWLCFDYFLEDVVNLEGWDSEKFKLKQIQLDKDKKQFDNNVKIYSPNTCMWLDKNNNNELQSSHCYKFKAISPNGEIHIYTSQHKCARENNLQVSSINKCLKKQRKHHKQWTFEKI